MTYSSPGHVVRRQIGSWGSDRFRLPRSLCKLNEKLSSPSTRSCMQIASVITDKMFLSILGCSRWNIGGTLSVQIVAYVLRCVCTYHTYTLKFCNSNKKQLTSWQLLSLAVVTYAMWEQQMPIHLCPSVNHIRESHMRQCSRGDFEIRFWKNRNSTPRHVKIL